MEYKKEYGWGLLAVVVIIIALMIIFGNRYDSSGKDCGIKSCSDLGLEFVDSSNGVVRCSFQYTNRGLPWATEIFTFRFDPNHCAKNSTDLVVASVAINESANASGGD